MINKLQMEHLQKSWANLDGTGATLDPLDPFAPLQKHTRLQIGSIEKFISVLIFSGGLVALTLILL